MEEPAALIVMIEIIESRSAGNLL